MKNANLFSIWLSRKALRGIAAAALALASIGVVEAQASGGVWDRIKSSGELHCAAMTDHLPTSWLVPGTDDYEGYLINLCRSMVPDLSKAMGEPIKVVFVKTDWSTIVLDTQAGRIDLAGALSITPERAKAIDMPGPAYSLADVIIYRKGFKPSTDWSYYDRPDVLIGNVSGTSEERVAHEKWPHATQMSFPDRPSLILAIQSGRVDLELDAYVSVLGMMKAAPQLFGGYVVPQPPSIQPSAFGVQKDGDGRFAKWVQAWSDKARASGLVREDIKDALVKAGLDTSDMTAIGK